MPSRSSGPGSAAWARRSRTAVARCGRQRPRRARARSRAVEQARDLRVGAAVAHIVVREDLVERPPALVLAHDVGGDALLLPRAGREKGERVPQEAREPGHGRDPRRVWGSPARLRVADSAARGHRPGFVELSWLESQREEAIAGAIRGAPGERCRRPGRRRAGCDLDRAPARRAVGGRPGGQPAVPAERRGPSRRLRLSGPRALGRADRGERALEDDVVVSEADGRAEKVRPFVREELLGPLERWFFGR